MLEELEERYLDISSIKNKYLNIQYGSYDRNQLDIYYPEVIRENMPCIVFIHGGALMKGDKRRYQLNLVADGIQHGFVVVSVNYRLASQYTYPSFFEDINAALRYLHHHSEQYHIDKSHIIMCGESAGALLAMVTSFNQTDQFVNNNINPYPQDYQVFAIIDYYGPVSLLEEKENKLKLREIQFGMKNKELYETLKSVSPLHMITRDSPYVIILHGKLDSIVDYEQSEMLYKKYQELNIANKAKIYLYDDLEHNPDQFISKSETVFLDLKEICNLN